MKKLLLGLGSLGVIVMPVAIVISCGSGSSTKTSTDTNTKSTDIKITDDKKVDTTKLSTLKTSSLTQKVFKDKEVPSPITIATNGTNIKTELGITFVPDAKVKELKITYTKTKGSLDVTITDFGTATSEED